LINSDPDRRYRIVKHVLTDPHHSVVLMRVQLEVADEALRGRLKVYALLAPHLMRGGADNSGWVRDFAAARFSGDARAHAHGLWLRTGFHATLGRVCRRERRLAGPDGQLPNGLGLPLRERGNIALTAELDPSRDDWILGVGFGASAQSAATKLLQTLADPFDRHREGYVRQWQRTKIGEQYDFNAHTGDDGSMYRLSHCVLLAHEDKIFQGAMIASLSIPWGETKGDDELGGYHLVWTRDLVQSATALLATGQTATPLRALIWLACIQKPDGDFPQNSWIDGVAYWRGVQLDEIASPILLAWRLQQANALRNFDPAIMISKARAFCAAGPGDCPGRWEEQSGYSPSTLAVVIAALVCAADFARQRSDNATADLILAYADWLAATYRGLDRDTRGELVPGKARHYVRITPADAFAPDPHPT